MSGIGESILWDGLRRLASHNMWLPHIVGGWSDEISSPEIEGMDD